MKKSILAIAVLIVSLAGCQSADKVSWEAPQVAAPVKTEPWTYGPMKGQSLITPHYIIHTTIPDNPAFLQRLAPTMEGGYAEYKKISPGIAESDRPMECWVFSKRPEWALFTAQHTGQDARLYLEINRGGYTVRGWFVAC